MHILIITPRFPYPPDKGDRLTVFNYLKFLSQRHRITLMTFIEPQEERFKDKIAPLCCRLITVRHNRLAAILNAALAIPRRQPFQIAYYGFQHAMKHQLEAIMDADPVDVIYCHTLRMAEYIKHLDTIPKVLALQISMALNYRRLKQFHSNWINKFFYAIEYLLVRSYEFDICRFFDKVLLISEKDLAEITRDRGPLPARVQFLPHGVDHRYFSPRKSVAKSDNRLVITGNMGYPPNQDAVLYFVKDVLPIILRAKPECELWVVGKNPPATLRNLADERHIFVTGEVPDIRDYLQQASVGVVPTRIAAGLQNKLIEGMAMALPMVATANANEGIKAKPDDEVLIADDTQDFANKVIHLLENPEDRARLAENGRRFIDTRFTWEYFLSDLEGLLGDLHAHRN